MNNIQDLKKGDLSKILDALATAQSSGFKLGQEHTLPSRGTLEKISDLEKRMDDKLSAKVSHTVFWSLVGILMAVVGGMFYLVYDKVSDVDSSLRTTSQDVNIIKGKLEK